MLSKEIATSLRGRYVSRLVLPYSFREYLTAVKMEIKEPLTLEEEGKMLKALGEYLSYGGFPVAAKKKTSTRRKTFLRLTMKPCSTKTSWRGTK